MRPIDVVLVDDQRLIRDGLSAVLSLQSGIRVVGEAEDGQQAVAVVSRTRPQVVLLDIRMPVMDGIAAARRICATLPQCRVLLLTTFDDDEYLFEGIQAGVAGYLLKSCGKDELVAAIETVAAGGSVLHAAVVSKVVAEFARLLPLRPLVAVESEALTRRECEVLSGIVSGESNGEIGARLGIAEGTVKNYVTSLLTKLGARNRVQAITRARELGLL